MTGASIQLGWFFTHSPLKSGKSLCILQTEKDFYSCECTPGNEHYAMAVLCARAR